MCFDLLNRKNEAKFEMIKSIDESHFTDLTNETNAQIILSAKMLKFRERGTFPRHRLAPHAPRGCPSMVSAKTLPALPGAHLALRITLIRIWSRSKLNESRVSLILTSNAIWLGFIRNSTFEYKPLHL